MRASGDDTPYRGRFAPSPTGDPHAGTLVAAVASYLQARSRNGEWLLRIEDVDTTRAVPGASDRMLRTLDRLGFERDGEVVVQSQRTGLYHAALERLQQQERTFECTCSRKLLAQTSADSGIYPGTCRGQRGLRREHAIRLMVEPAEIAFEDAVAGRYRQNLATQCGDFVIRRRDGLFAYQLAVVVDDAEQGITEIVRGADLLDSTPRQIYLQRLLGYATPEYLHLPLILDSHGRKLSKSDRDHPVDIRRPGPVLLAALHHLGQKPPDELLAADTKTIWSWARENWDPYAIPKVTIA